MFTVEAQEKAKALIEVYKEAYTARYGSPPIIVNEAADRTILSDLVKKVGEPFAANIIRQYLKMNGEGRESTWFADKGHTISVLDKNFAAVHTAMAVHQRNAIAVRTYDPMIVFESQCPGCNQFFNITCRATEAEKRAYTDYCPACQDLPSAA